MLTAPLPRTLAPTLFIPPWSGDTAVYIMSLLKIFPGRPTVYNTRNSSGDEIANVNFLYDNFVYMYYKIQYMTRL